MEKSPSQYYTPTPEDIYNRSLAIRIMTDWPDWLIDSVMFDDSPTAETVIRLSERYGVYEACQKIEGFTK
jgi:hypothetical protein